MSVRSMSDPVGLLDEITRVLITPRPDCLLWPAGMDRGYGRLDIDDRLMRVHRVIWELTVGPIPEGMTIDHLCRVRSCCNTDHMEVVTPEENTSRAAGFPKLNPNKRRKGQAADQCRNGHKYESESDVYVHANGSRRCRACREATEKRRPKRVELRRNRTRPKPALSP